MTRKLSTLFFALATLFLPALASALPGTVSFSARIADNGRPVTGSHEFTFAFWDCDGSDPVTCVDPANVVWTETQTLDVQDGVVSAVLGADDVTPNLFPPALFNGSARWLAVAMDGTAFGPFMAVHSVPYALRAGAAENLQCAGQCVQDSEIQTVSASKVAGSFTNVTVTGTLDVGLERVQSASVSINGGGTGCANYANGACYFGSNSVSCPTGKRLVGGGCFIGGTIVLANIMGSYPASLTAWGCFANSSNPGSSLVAYAICARQ